MAKRSTFNLSNYQIAAGDFGRLYPVQLQEVLPGDTFRMQTSLFLRMMPMMAPVMHPVTVRIHHWFVPNRILWDKWEDFITGGPDGQNVDSIPTKSIASGDPDFYGGSLASYMGLPIQHSSVSDVNVLPFRAYNMIWNNFYRDQDLMAESDLDNVDNCYAVAWRKDYFTAARPFQQKGHDITLPIGDTAPVYALSNLNVRDATGTAIFTSVNRAQSGLDPEYRMMGHNGAALDENQPIFVHKSDVDSKIFADLSAATGVTAVQFREFFALQRYAEARARYGSRYTEYLRYLGIKPSDARLQLPEYLGGGKTTISFNEVMQTAEGTNPVGTMRGSGVAGVRTKPVRRFFEEHGYVLTLLSIVPKAIYTDGTHRTFTRQLKEDFYTRELARIGQQAIYNKEVFDLALTGAGGDENEDVFGYTDRYSEYWSTPSKIIGWAKKPMFDNWHLARKFASRPNLNSTFVACNPTKRYLADQNVPTWIAVINNKVKARRMMSKKAPGGTL